MPDVPVVPVVPEVPEVPVVPEVPWPLVLPVVLPPLMLLVPLVPELVVPLVPLVPLLPDKPVSPDMPLDSPVSPDVPLDVPVEPLLFVVLLPVLPLNVPVPLEVVPLDVPLDVPPDVVPVCPWVVCPLEGWLLELVPDGEVVCPNTGAEASINARLPTPNVRENGLRVQLRCAIRFSLSNRNARGKLARNISDQEGKLHAWQPLGEETWGKAVAVSEKPTAIRKKLQTRVAEHA